MADKPIDPGALFEQFGKLGRRDRKAVMAQLTLAERERVAAAMAAQDDSRRREADRVRQAGRQFAGYSPWLAELLQHASADEAGGEKGGPKLSDATRRTVAEIHRAIRDAGEESPQGFTQQMRQWAATLLSPPAKGRS